MNAAVEGKRHEHSSCEKKEESSSPTIFRMYFLQVLLRVAVYASGLSVDLLPQVTSWPLPFQRKREAAKRDGVHVLLVYQKLKPGELTCENKLRSHVQHVWVVHVPLFNSNETLTAPRGFYPTSQDPQIALLRITPFDDILWPSSLLEEKVFPITEKYATFLFGALGTPLVSK